MFLEQSAVFTCETVAGSSTWKINGTQRALIPPDIRRDLETSEIITDEWSTVEELRIPARAEYNGTRVQCVVLTFGSSVESDSAFLMIQGM